MNRNVLIGVLALQVIVIVAVVSARSAGPNTPADLLMFDPATVDAISVSNAEGTVELVFEDRWQFTNGIPADASKVSEILDKLADAGGDWPVATTSSSATRFEVTEESHQRRIVLRDDDTTLADVFLGTSPGYQRVHARVMDASDIYAIKFSNYEAGVRTSDWLDRSLLQAEGELSVVQREGAFNLSKSAEGSWVSLDGTAVDSGDVETLIGRLRGLMATGVFEGELPLETAFSFSLTDDEGAYQIDFFRVGEDAEDFVATTSRLSGAFDVATYVAEQLDVTLEDLGIDEPVDDLIDIAEDPVDPTADQ